MIEAYEIGISLALSDGVSDSIAAARRDMAAIDVAIRSNQVSLAQLRHAASGMRSPAAEIPARLARLTAARPVVPEPVPDAPPAAAGQPTARRDPAKGPIAPAVFPEMAAPQVAITAAPEVAVAERAVVPGQVRWIEAKAAETGRERFVAAPGGGAPVTKPMGPVQAASWRSTVRVAPLPGSPPAPAAAAAPAAAMVRAEMQTRDRPVGVAAGYAPPSGRPAVDLGAIAAPGGVLPEGPTERSRAFAAQAGPRQLPAPLGAAATDGTTPTHTGGDVYLDGALVGRWLARHLSREAGRAGAGPTGFDSRRSALLPGATVGP